MTQAPPLDMDLNSIKTDFPLLAPGIYDLQIAKVEAKTSKANSPMLHLELRTTAAGVAQDGTQLGPGTVIFDNLNLAPSGKSTWEIVLRNVASVTQACGIATTWGDFQGNAVALLTGKIPRCKVGIEPAGTDKNGKSFKAKNVVEVWMKPGQ